MIGKDIFIATRPEIPTEFINTITRQTFENIEEAHDIHILFSGMSLEAANRDLDDTIEIHPRSVRYFDEVGVS